MKKGKGKKFYPKDGASGRKGVMVNRTSARMHNFVAPHFLTKLECGFTGTSAGLAGGITYFSVRANGLHFPMDDGAGAAPSFLNAATANGTAFPATLALGALEPAGYTQLSVIYAQYRVYASKIQITVQPTGAVSAIEYLCVYPSDTDATVIATDFQRAMSQPYSKCITCTAQNNVKQNTIQMYLDNPTILGLTRQQYNDLGATASVTNANPNSDTHWNIVVSNTGAVQAAYTVEVRVTYWVEFFDQLPPTDI